jgi:hypothetical protein
MPPSRGAGQSEGRGGLGVGEVEPVLAGATGIEAVDAFRAELLEWDRKRAEVGYPQLGPQ